MGDDHLLLRPFNFFSDYSGDVADAVRENRPKEAARSAAFLKSRLRRTYQTPMMLGHFYAAN